MWGFSVFLLTFRHLTIHERLLLAEILIIDYINVGNNRNVSYYYFNEQQFSDDGPSAETSRKK